MKNTLLLSLMLGILFTISLPKAAAQLQQAPLTNIEGNVNSIVSKLKTALSLTTTQQPKLQTAVTAFLQQRSNILPLANSNPKAYDTKLNSIHNGFNRKLKSILTPEQFTGLQELKPTENDNTNVLSQLFY
jgi:hypothetical protein